MMHKAGKANMYSQDVIDCLRTERARLQKECFSADTPYAKDGVMASFKCTGGDGSYTLEPKSRYVKLKFQ